MDSLRWAARIAAILGLEETATTFPGGRSVLRRAAEAVAATIPDEFAPDLRLEADPPREFETVLARFADSPGPHREQSDFAGSLPPLLLYALGAWWGEWLVKHRHAQWLLGSSVTIDLACPDRVIHEHVACFAPFAQVARALPANMGESVKLPPEEFFDDRRHLWPYPLIAAEGEAAAAYIRLLPEPARRAMEIEQMLGDYHTAWEFYRHAIELHPASPPLLARVVACAWRLEEWDWVESVSERLLDLAPDHPTTMHNLAVLYSRSSARLPEAVAYLRAAISVNPNYSRARLTLASCLMDMRRAEEAIEHARWVFEHDSRLRTPAEDLLRAAGFLPE